MKQLYSLLFLLVAMSSTLLSEDFRGQFRECASRKDTACQYSVLQRWQTAAPDDPELYVACINYYAAKSRREVVSIDSEPANELSLRMEKNDDSTAVAYMNSYVSYDEAELNRGFACIDTGIAKFPNRLDMRFGKIYMLDKQGNYKDFTAEIVAVVEHSARNNNQWTWANNKPVDDPEQFMLTTLQDYVIMLYKSDRDYIDNIRAVAGTVLMHYPGHVESLSNMAVTHLAMQEYDQALVFLLRAEAIAPTDPVIVGNIAWCYDGMEDKTNAILYYDRLLQCGDEDAIEHATERLEELRGK